MQNENMSLRAWRMTDIETLVRYANNRKIWLNLRDRFPHPYTHADALEWITHCESEAEPKTQFAIDIAGNAIGGIGLERLGDVHRMSAEIGYWLGEPFWGKGIATAALLSATDYAFRELGLERLQAMVFEWNGASARVLQKAGYAIEGRLRRSVIKDGRLIDSLMYARLRA
jgi:[ribosomal protein S5]-alanine N-acetyltransferase